MAGVSSIFRLSLALFLAVVVVATGLAEGATRSQRYSQAVQLFGDSGESWSRLSAAHLAAGDKDKANEAAKNALRYSFAHVKALSSLGITEFDGGDKDKGKQLVSLAGELSWRDSLSQSWLFQQALLARDYETAMLHADALLRREKAEDQFFGLFNLAALDPTLRAPLIKQFESKANWRARYFTFAKSVPPEQYDSVETIVSALRDSDAPVTQKELTPYTMMLIGKEQVGRSLNLWNANFPATNKAPGTAQGLSWSVIENANETRPTDWRITSNRDIRTTVSGGAEKKNDLLSVALNRGASGVLAWRYMPAQSDGLIRLKLSGSYGSQGLRWSATCIPTGNQTYLTASASDSTIWQASISPACEAYKLSLELKLGGVQNSADLSLPSATLVN